MTEIEEISQFGEPSAQTLGIQPSHLNYRRYIHSGIPRSGIDPLDLSEFTHFFGFSLHKGRDQRSKKKFG